MIPYQTKSVLKLIV